jgi:hypothetical protein
MIRRTPATTRGVTISGILDDPDVAAATEGSRWLAEAGGT